MSPEALAVALQLAPLLQHFMSPSGDVAAAAGAMLRAAAVQAAAAASQRAEAVAAEAHARNVLQLIMRVPPAGLAAAMAALPPVQLPPPAAAPAGRDKLPGQGEAEAETASALAALAALGGAARSAE